jgi:hypothetical protein
VGANAEVVFVGLVIGVLPVLDENPKDEKNPVFLGGSEPDDEDSATAGGGGFSLDPPPNPNDARIDFLGAADAVTEAEEAIAVPVSLLLKLRSLVVISGVLALLLLRERVPLSLLLLPPPPPPTVDDAEGGWRVVAGE